MIFNNIAQNIYTANQIKRIDDYTIKKKQITAIELMEIAANKFVIKLLFLFNNANQVYIFCGPGNYLRTINL